MPRKARVMSATGIYHVMLRGVNRQQIFYDEEDYAYFVKTLDRFKYVCGFRLYAYCIMGNHIHLLIQEGLEPVEGVIKRLSNSFVYWYNMKYERTGHLFQGRFKSEPVNDEPYFYTVLRYILRNPVVAGMCHSPEYYSYSSAKEYIQGTRGITDILPVRNRYGRKELIKYIMQENDDDCLELKRYVRRGKTDTMAKNLILEEFGTYSPAVEDNQNRKSFNESVRRILARGVSIRQLSRLTGISKKIIENAKKETGDKETGV